MNIKIIFLIIIFFLTSQSYHCLENGINELISNNLELKSIDYKISYIGKTRSYLIDNKIEIELSDKASSIKLKGTNDKKCFKKSDIPLNLDDVFILKNKNEVFYIFQFMTYYQGVSRNTYNIIIKVNNKTFKILYRDWNTSGEGIQNAFGLNNDNIFFLNQVRDSINYYEFNMNKVKYNKLNSVKTKLDSIGNVCVPEDYKF